MDPHQNEAAMGVGVLDVADEEIGGSADAAGGATVVGADEMLLDLPLELGVAPEP